MNKTLALATSILLATSVASFANETHKKHNAGTTTGMSTNADKAAKNTNSQTTPKGDLDTTKNNPTQQSLQK